MKLTEVKIAFEALVAARGWSSQRPPEAISLVTLMLDWFASERVDGVDLAADGDMVLFQWGTYDVGDGPAFQVDITRQLIDATEVDDDAFWQLSATLRYPVDPALSAIGAGDRWCMHPGHADELRAFVATWPALPLVAGRPGARFTLDFKPAG